jgi:hypothetical protein
MRQISPTLKTRATPDLLIGQLRERFNQFTDHRASNSSFALSDILMSGFAMFSLKYASLLQFETQSEVERQNLAQLYGIKKVCTDSQMRKVLDLVSPYPLQDLFPFYYEILKQLGVLKQYPYLGRHLVVAIDGVTHFESQKVHCPCCIEKANKDGTRSYSHSMLCAMLVHPIEKEVFVMGTEAIVCQDGVEKNDCERNASKRLLDFLAVHYQGQPLLITEDALYANAPNVSQILDNNWSYVLAIKPDGNKSLFAAFADSSVGRRTGRYSYKDERIEHTFRYVNNLPINGSNADIRVNVLHYEQTDKKGKVTRFSWMTNLELNQKTVTSIMRIGRSRWKIENETGRPPAFNTLKNQGYNFEHNYGHGKRNLSTVLAYLMLLAFQVDQLIQSAHKPFRQILKATKTKVKFWHTIRALFMVQSFQSFEEMYAHTALLFKVQLE